jgi:hypothetical protein
LTKNVKWNISVYVEEGPTLVSSEQIVTEAVDAVTVILKPGDKDKPVLVQPSPLDKIHFICIKSDRYESLEYIFNDGTADSDKLLLDKAHFLTSTSLIGLFKKAPKTIKFSNSGTNDAKIDIVVARQAAVEVSS